MPVSRRQLAIVSAVACVLSLWVAVPQSANAAVPASPVSFSVGRGLYSAPVDVALSSDPGTQIRWTLDGTTPTASVGQVYSGPLHVTTTTTLRAVAYGGTFDPSPVVTVTYVFPADVVHQPNTRAGWPSFNASVGSDGGVVPNDYGMDPDIVNATPGRVEAALRAVPTISITSPFGDIFGPSGWYETDDIEKRVSVELIDPSDPTKSSQIDAGIEGHSHNRLKRAFKLNFRSEYGQGKWTTDLLKGAPLNGAGASTRLDKLVLRSGNNRCWCRSSNPSRTTYTEDQWFRDSQIALSGHGPHGQFVHLYINGVYWGLYNTVENPDDSFQADYFGGSEEDYWSISHNGPHGTASSSRWDYLTDTLVNKDMTDPANYAELQQYVDLDNFADYLTLQFYGGVTDWPNNNWWAGNRMTPTPGPLRYFEWDGEWSWDVRNGGDGTQNGAWVPPSFRPGNSDASTINAIWRGAIASPEFRLKLADRVNRAIYNGGALTEANAKARFATLNSYVSEPVVAESARWGDALESLGQPTRTRDVDWQREVDVINNLMTGNPARLVAALKTYGYYPGVDAPTMSQHGGNVTPGFSLSLTNPNASGSIYYTTDGSDPRAVGGAVAPTATLYTAAIPIPSTMTVRARVLAGSQWSAQDAATFSTPDLPTLAISELHYNAIDGNNFEFIEITNTGSAPVQLGGVKITTAVDFTFPTSTLAPGAHTVAVKLPTSFTARYGTGPSVAGTYSGNLASEGERVVLQDAFGRPIQDFTYQRTWYPTTDAGGYSLVRRSGGGDPTLSSSWRASTQVHGSPGAADPIGVSVDDATTAEGNSGTHLVSAVVRLNDVPATAVTASFGTTDGTATAPSDYVQANGTVSFAASGPLTKSVDLTVRGDAVQEGDESFSLDLSAPTGGVITDASGQVTITDDDAPGAPPVVSTGDATTTEGNAGDHDAVVDVTLSAPAASTATVDWATSNGSAVAPEDFASGSGTVTFAAGETSKQIRVPVHGDQVWEPDESLGVVLSAPTGASLGTSTATVTISNDDSLPSVRVDDASVTEGNSGHVVASVPVTLTGSSSAPVSVTWSTASETATAGSDFAAGSGTLVFPAGGPSTQSIAVTVHGDTVDEPDETVQVSLGTVTGATVSDGSAVLAITDDDVPAPVQRAVFIAGSLPLSAADQVVAGRLSALGFTVSLLDDADTSAAAVAGASLVVYSASGSSSFMSRLAGVAVPVVTWEAAGYDDLGMTAAGGSAVAKRNVDIGAGDPMGSGLSGRLDVLSVTGDQSYAAPPASALVQARAGGTTKATVFGFVTGAQMASRAAPARRVALFLTDVSATSLTAQGTTLLDAALRWAAGAPAGPPPPVNAAPAVAAGNDQTVALSAGSAALDGTVSDDGLPGPSVTTTWSKVSGPSGTGFGNASAVDTSVTFSSVGTYVLRLTADDGQLSAFDELTLTVTGGGGPPPAGAAVFIAGSLPLSAADQVVAGRLSALGFTVSLLDDADTSAAAVAGASLVVYSASGSSSFMSRLAGVAVPVVTWEAAGYDDLGMTAAGGSTVAKRNVDIGAGDPMGSGLSGRLDVLSVTGDQSYAAPPASALVQARAGGTTKATVFGFVTGAQMASRAAPARRVALFLTDVSATSLTAQGTTLLDAALRWAAAM